MKITVLAQFLTTEFKAVPGEEDEVRSMLGYSPKGMVGKAMAERFRSVVLNVPGISEITWPEISSDDA
jgi:hypothetical protein